MGLVNAKVTLKNPRKTKLKPVEVLSLAVPRNVYLCIPDRAGYNLN